MPVVTSTRTPRASTPLRGRVSTGIAGAWLVLLPLVYFRPGWGRPREGGGEPAWRHGGLPELGLLWPVAATCVVLLAAAGAGVLPAARLAPAARGLDRALLVLALGLGALSAAGLGLAAAGAYRPAPLVALTSLLAAAGLWVLARALRGTRLATPRLEPTDWLAAAVLLSAAAFAVVGALAPETEYDAIWYHLGFPATWLRDGGVTDFPCQFVTAYPFGAELVYGIGLALDGPAAGKLLHLAFGVLLVLAVYRLGRRLFTHRAALAGAVVLATAPTVLWEATTAYVDLAAAFFLVLALDRALEHVRSPARRTVVLAGLLAGLAVATKLSVLLAVPGLLVVLLAAPRPARARWGDLLAAAAAGVAPALPWLLRAEVLTGNPVFPSLYGVFGADPDRWTARSDAGLDRFMDKFGAGHGPEDLLALPWNLTMHAADFGGSYGVLFLLLVPFALRWPARRASLLTAVFAAAFFVLWFSPVSSQQARFVLPGMAVLAPFAGAGLERVATAAAQRARPLGAAVVLLAAGLAVLALPPFTEWHERGAPGTLTHVLRRPPLAHVLGVESSDAYLTRRLAGYAAGQRLAELAEPGDRVVTSADIDNLHTSVEHVPDFAVCLDPVYAARTDGEVLDRLRALDVRFVLQDLRRPTDYPDALLNDPGFQARHLELVHRDDRAALYRITS